MRSLACFVMALLLAACEPVAEPRTLTFEEMTGCKPEDQACIDALDSR